MSIEKSYNFFLDNKEKLMKEHAGWYVVFKDGKICGVYNSELATEMNARKYGDDLFIIHFDPAGPKEYHLKK